jgi:hypothetical protein
MKHNVKRSNELQQLAIAALSQKLLSQKSLSQKSLSQKSLSSLFSILILTGMFSVGSVFVESGAIALTLNRQPLENLASNSTPKGERDLATKPTGSSQLPSSLANKLRQDLSKRLSIPAGKLRVLEASRQSWPNGCLGLEKPGEMCTFMIVEGWRVVLSDGSRRWVYRTDSRGLNFRLETANRPTPPTSDGRIKPTQMALNELPPALDGRIIFRAIASGGFTGRTYETTLTRDGRVIRVLVSPNGITAKPETRRVSQQQVWQFQQLLQQHHLEQFHRLSYPATPGSADFTTITLLSHSSTVRYADTIQDQLPSSLRTIIQAWNQIARLRVVD